MKKVLLARALLSGILLVCLPACKPLEWLKSLGGGHEQCGPGGCGPQSTGGAADAQTPMVTFADKVALTVAEYEQNVETLMQAQAGIKEMIACMPAEQQAQIYDNILEGLANERLIMQWIKDQGLDQTAEYKDNARKAREAIERDLAIRTFERELSKQLEVSDDEAREWYAKNRERLVTHPFVENIGGIKAQGFYVTSESQAKDAVAKANRPGADFAKIAQEAQQKVTDFGIVNMQSSSPEPQVRSKLVMLKQFPAVEMVKVADNKYAVIKAVSKQEPVFCAFEKVKDAAKDRLKEERYAEFLRKKIDELRNQYSVRVNKEYLKQRVQASAPQSITEQSMTEQPESDSVAQGKAAAPVVA